MLRANKRVEHSSTRQENMNTKLIVKYCILLLLVALGGSLFAAPVTQYTNTIFPVQTFTATSQTGSTIQLGQSPSGNGGAFAVATISVNGTALTTVTFSVYGSSDGGVTFYALPINAIATPGTIATTATATTAGLYQVNLAGITQVQIRTSGTFTATNATFVLTASPNGVIARLGSGSGGGPPTGAAGGQLGGTYPNPTVTGDITPQALVGANTFYATSYTGATIAEEVNACLTAAIAVGGVCDASGFTGTGLNENGGAIVAATLDATIVVGNLFGSPVSLILPGWAWWEWNMTGGTSCGIQQYSGTQITTKDFGSAIQGLSVYSAATGSNLLAVLCVNASSSQSGGNYVFDGGFGINNGPFSHGAVTASGAAVLINGGLDDVSTFDHLGVGDNLDTYAVEVEGGICCSATFRSVQFNGFNTTIPLYFNNTTGNSLSAVNIVDSSIVHNPTGSPLILVSDTSAAHASNINISNLYSEVYPTSGTTQGELAIQGAAQVNVSNWTLKAESGSMSNPAISTSTAANTSLAVRSLYMVSGGGSWTATVNPISNGNVSASLGDPRVDSGGNFQEYLYSSNSSPGIIGSLWSMGNINGMSMYSWGTANTTIGGSALPLTSTGTNDTAVGGNALGDNTSGSSNTAVGGFAGALETSGSDNTSVGYHALEQLTTGGNNTAIGYQAGQNGTVVQTNSNSTFLGYEAYASVNALTNDTALGAGSMVTASNQVVIGNSSVTDVYLGSGGTTVGAAANLHANTILLPTARKGTFVCTGAGTISIANANEAITSDVVISLNIAGGTITTPPAMKTVTAGTGFTVLCGATDTSTYNYDILN